MNNLLTSALVLALLASLSARADTNTIVLKNDKVLRELKFDGHVWRTTRFARADGSDELKVNSDEFQIRHLNGAELTSENFYAAKNPVRETIKGVQRVTIQYLPRVGQSLSVAPPASVTVTYSLGDEPFVRKSVRLVHQSRAEVDRLEVERFSVDVPASRGGRGEPVFVNNDWFFGVEYPAAHSRHTDGNTPVAGSGYYDKVGNYSDVQLDGTDIEKNPRPGLIRLFHFPGYSKEHGDGTWIIEGKTSVAGVGKLGDSMEVAFRDYLDTIRRKPRSYTHYNNWFDGDGKRLAAENWARIAREFRTNLAPYGVTMDGMVPDNGWQNGASIWQPSKGHFPNGMDDLAKLGAALRAEGTSLGLWLSLDSTQCNIGWGEKEGYVRAKANKYFSQYFAHYSLSHPKYRAEMLRQLPALIKAGQLTYMKHDFNHLSDIGEGNGHPATDRHGHEANVDAMIEMLEAEIAANPDIYLNLTNWMWYSPWWLMWGDAIWMLAGDDGYNKNTPDISLRQMATTDRDTFIWRMFGKADERPLLPVSHLMTHGIIRNPGGQMESREDTLRDFSDHVVMYYGRGSQMKEWYITPRAMTPDHWKILGRTHRWAFANFKALCNMVIVGGRPDEGNAYGYIGWDGDHGVLVARNTSMKAQTLAVPFDQTTLFRGAAGRSFRAKVIYPYQDNWPAKLTSGQTMNFEIPAYSTLVFDIAPGDVAATFLSPGRDRNVPATSLQKFTVPKDAVNCDLLAISYAEMTTVTINGEAAKPKRTSAGTPNQFAGYARHGMPSDKARAWRMASFDLQPFAGKEISVALAGGKGGGTAEAWLMVDEKVSAPAAREDVELPWAIAQNERRFSYCLLAETNIAPAPQKIVSLAELRAAKSVALEGEAFGVNGGEFGEKEIVLNGNRIGALPNFGDDWKSFRIELDATTRASLQANNAVVVRTNGKEDKFKFRELVLTIGPSGGSTSQEKPQTSFGDWVHFEGVVFASRTNSLPVSLNFK